MKKIIISLFCFQLFSLNLKASENDSFNEDIFNEFNCTEYLNKYIESLNTREYQNSSSDPIDTYKLLFKRQNQLQERFYQFVNPSKSCVDAMRSGIRMIRYKADTLIENLHAEGKVFGDKKIFSEIGVQTLINETKNIEESFDSVTLKSGDVVLMRGSTFVSSLIARIGDEAADFSHLGVIGEDGDGNKYMVEAEIETGVVMTPIEKWLKKEKPRIAVYRFKDENIAQIAGRKIFEYTKNRLDKNGNIPYDFKMDPDDHNEIFCSEVARIAFEMATKSNIVLPRYKTSFYKMKEKEIFNDLGLEAIETFSPNDIELDSNFNLVAEYRYLGALRKLKVQDVMMSSLFKWSANYQYKFSSKIKSIVLSSVAKLARKLGIAKDKLQKHMPRKVISAIIRLNDLTGIIEKHIEELVYKNTLSYFELENELEKYREQDCLDYWNERSDDDSQYNVKNVAAHFHFHHLYNNPNKKCHF